MYLILGDADRERLGAPERLSLDLSTITNREAIQLRTMGYRTPRLFREALRASRLDADGNEVTGEEDSKLAADGGKVVDFEVDYNAWTVLVWLALKRAGIATDVRELEFDLDAVRTADDEPEEPAAPKDEPAQTDPEASTV